MPGTVINHRVQYVQMIIQYSKKKKYNIMKNLLILLVAVSLFSPGCKKLIEQEEEKQFPWHFEASINDKDYKWQANDNGSDIVNLGWEQMNANGDETDMFQGTIFLDPADETRNTLIVGLLKYFPTEPSQSEQLAMFHTGGYSWGVGDVSTSTVNGAVVVYTDGNGKTWSTDLGAQTGSNFNITEIEDAAVAGGKNIRVLFNCKLYDDQGNMIPLVNGAIRGKIFYQ